MAFLCSQSNTSRLMKSFVPLMSTSRWYQSSSRSRISCKRRSTNSRCFHEGIIVSFFRFTRKRNPEFGCVRIWMRQNPCRFTHRVQTCHERLSAHLAPRMGSCQTRAEVGCANPSVLAMSKNASLRLATCPEGLNGQHQCVVKAWTGSAFAFWRDPKCCLHLSSSTDSARGATATSRLHFWTPYSARLVGQTRPMPSPAGWPYHGGFR